MFIFWLIHNEYKEKAQISWSAYDRLCDRGLFIQDKRIIFGKTVEIVKAISAYEYYNFIEEMNCGNA